MSTLRMGLMTPPLLSVFPRRLLLSLLLLSTFAAQAVSISVTPPDLSTNVIQFIPRCAQECFRTFINLDFPSSGCGSSPSLQCLCSRTGSRGFTLGEMAVQCLFAEATVGGCSEDEANALAYNRALLMCNGQVSAAPRTHTAINATVVVPESGTGSIIIERPTVTATTTTAAGILPSRTMLTAISTRTPAVTSSTSTRSTSSTTLEPASSSSALTSAEISDEVPNPGASVESDSQKLGLGGILGIILGTIIVVTLIIGALIFYCRKRRRTILGNDRKSRRSMFIPAVLRRRSSDTDIGFGPPMSVGSSPQDSLRPTMFPRTSMDPAAIGLAITPMPSQRRSIPPNRAVVKQKTHPFPLHPLDRQNMGSEPSTSTSSPTAVGTLRKSQSDQSTPAKPVLTLAIPSPSSADERGPPVPPKRRQTGQSSLLNTPFEEDGYEDEPNSSTQIWRPPRSAGPNSSSTYYVADKQGNWVLGDMRNPFRRSQCIELEAPGLTPPIERQKEGEKEKGKGKEREEEHGALGMLRNQAQMGQNSGINAAGGYRPPVRGIGISSPQQQQQSQSQQNQPQRYIAGAVKPNANLAQSRELPQSQANRLSWTSKFNFLSQPRRSPAQGGNSIEKRSSAFSDNSVTTIDSNDGDIINDSNNNESSSGTKLSRQQSQQQKNLIDQGLPSAGLSPVVESPASSRGARSQTSSGGKSPVSYPRIPRPSGVGFANLERRPSQTIKRVAQETREDGQGQGQRQKPPRRIDTLSYKPQGQPSPTLGTVSLVSGLGIENGYGVVDESEESVYPKPLKGQNRYQYQFSPPESTSSFASESGNNSPQSEYQSHTASNRGLTERYRLQGNVAGATSTMSSGGSNGNTPSQTLSPPMATQSNNQWSRNQNYHPSDDNNNNNTKHTRQGQGLRLDFSSPPPPSPVPAPLPPPPPPVYNATGRRSSNSNVSAYLNFYSTTGGEGTVKNNDRSSTSRGDDPFDSMSPTGTSYNNERNEAKVSQHIRTSPAAGGGYRAGGMKGNEDEKDEGEENDNYAGKWNRDIAAARIAATIDEVDTSSVTNDEKERLQWRRRVLGLREKERQEDQQLSITPVPGMGQQWMPMLTPTRRGEDLVLSVE